MARRNRAKRTPPPRQLPVSSQEPLSTPLNVKGRIAHALDHPGRDDRLDHVETSSRGKWFGPVSPAKFIKTFLPDSPPTQRPRFVRTAWENATPSSAEVKKEKDMYDRFVKAAASFCPSHDVKVTDHSYDNVSWPGEDKQNLIELDVTIYPEGITLDPQRKLDISRVRSFCELKFSEADSGFDDSEGRPFEKEAVNSRKIRGQLATYASAIMATQFRTHVFCVEVTGHHARLIRFDREGAVVTSAFRYDEKPHLVDFLWRFSHATPANQGYDPSVTRAPPTGSKARLARKVLNLDSKADVWRFEVHDEESNKDHVFYGAISPLSLSLSPFGRCTRGLVVIDIHGNKVYLKDTWRIVRQGMVKEGDVYAKLHKAKVSHIPHPITHGDASPGGLWQKTVSLSCPRLVSTDEDRKRPFAHYFIAFREIGRSLRSFSTTWELVNSIKDAMAAHQEAYTKAKVLHRDVSAGNILISEDGKEGFLIDWDFSKEVSDDIETPRQPERTGTWQFMSANLLLGKSEHHTRADDLESFFYVLCWVTLKLGPHKLPKADVAGLIQRWFDYGLSLDGIISGGQNKRSEVQTRHMAREAQLTPGTLRDLIVDFEDLVAVRFEDVPSDDDRAQYVRLFETYPSDDPLITRDPVYKYDTRKRRLDDWDWIYGRFCQAVEDPSQLSDRPFDHAAQTVAVTTLGNRSALNKKRTSEHPATTGHSSKKPRK